MIPAVIMFLIRRLLKFTKEELPWFTGTFLQSVTEIKDLVKLFDPIANTIVKYGTIESIAILEVELKGPRKIGWKNSKWPALFRPRAVPIPSSTITLHEDNSSVIMPTKG